MRFISNQLREIEVCASQQQCFSDLVYTSFPEAKEELFRRRENKDLRDSILKYLNGDIPDPLLNGPKALLFRQLLTPNHELKKFIEIISNTGIDPLFFEYYEDKFTSCNPLKHALGKLKFCDCEKKYPNNLKTKTIIEFNKYDGKRIIDVHTIWGKNLVDFHHALVEEVYNNCSNNFFDATKWFHRAGISASKYYSKYIALFVQNAILFENFILEDPELSFVKSIFLPSFLEISNLFGCKPLIVPLLPISTQADAYWHSYPMEIFTFIEEKNMIK